MKDVVNVSRVVPRDQVLELLAHARELPDVPTCADCGSGLGRDAGRVLCGLCYANRLVHGERAPSLKLDR